VFELLEDIRYCLSKNKASMQYCKAQTKFKPQRRWQRPIGHRTRASTSSWTRISSPVSTEAHDNPNNCAEKTHTGV